MPKPVALALLAVLLLPLAGAAGAWAGAWEAACDDDCCPCSGLAARTCAGCACCPGPVALAQPPRLAPDLAIAPLFLAPAPSRPSAPSGGVFHVPRPA